MTHGLALDLTESSTQDLEAMVAILDKYHPDVRELAKPGELPLRTGARRRVAALSEMSSGENSALN
jgi:hypothetical protein